jgi:RNA 2',3'-cyclic 3'-phosphodiesterase
MARLRTFIAVDIGRKLRDCCIDMQENLARLGVDVKWVDAENLHVTLLFLGEVDERTIPAVCKAVAGVCAEREPFALSVEKVGCFGSPRRPRTLWAGIGEGAEELKALHDALEPPLLELGCYRHEERQFTPHITLGRAKSADPDDTLPAALKKYATWNAGEVEVREVLVMSSELTRTGPIYCVLSRARFRKSDS